MEASEEQFQELIANLAVRVNKMLGERNEISSIGLLLSASGEIEVVLAVPDGNNLKDEITLLQKGLIEKSQKESSVAACLAYADYENEVVVALLENSENFCAQVKIPVISNPNLQLDLEKMVIEDGMVFVFGATDT